MWTRPRASRTCTGRSSRAPSAGSCTRGDPRGGWSRRTWTAPGGTAGALLYLLAPGETSAWHREGADELWLWHRGGPLGLRVGGGGEAPVDAGAVVLGPAVELGQAVQALVPGGTWRTAGAPPAREVLVSRVAAGGGDRS